MDDNQNKKPESDDNYEEAHMRDVKVHAPWCSLNNRAKAEEAKKASSGAVSPAYRANYDSIFGKKIPVGNA